MTPTAANSDASRPAPVDEGLLVTRARQGEVTAFEALYRSHYRSIYALALRMVRRVPLAEELCQETFITAWRSLPAFRGDSAFGTWLHGIAVREILGRRRSEGRRREVEGVAARSADHEAAMVRAMPDTRLDLERAISALPPKARLVILLHDVQGWPQRDIAKAMEIAVGTVKSQLHRARSLIKEDLT